jgi:hypothetical protein
MLARESRKVSQTRCELTLVLCEGTTYALPLGSGAMPQSLPEWASETQPEYLDVIVSAGTIVSGAAVHGGALIACDMYGVRVLVPCEVLEEVN